jgi:hypothetical protein
MLVRERVLVLRERDAGRVDAVFLRRAHRERTPPAADVEEFLSGLEHQLVADVVELLQLRLLERVLLGLEVRARINHARVEPELVELVGDVVVVLDRLAVVAPAMARAMVQRSVEEVVRGRRGLADRLGAADRLAQVALHVGVPVDVGLGEREQAGLGERGGAARAVELQRDPGALVERDLAPIPEHHAHRRMQVLLQIRQRVLDRPFPEHESSLVRKEPR